MERQRLVSHLEMTAGWFLDEVSTLSRPQLEFRRAAGSWNILEVIDHLVVVGQIYWDDLQQALKTPPRDLGLAGQDAHILWYGIDRTHRETAIPSENPGKKLPDLQAALAELPETSRAAAAVRQDDQGRPPEPLRREAAVRRVSVGAADLDARAAAHPSDPGNQGGFEVSQEVLQLPASSC